MQAVVLAAGAGQRFRRTVADVPKPLYRVHGVMLVERAIRTARMAGCDEVVVVTGAAAEEVERAVVLPGRPWVRTVRAAGWERGNGASLLAAAPYLREPFLVLMADHVMDPAIVVRAARAAGDFTGILRDGAAVLVVDPRLEQVHDLDEATKVRRHGDRIEDIGKELGAFDGVDTGVFIGSRGLLAALEEVAARPDQEVTLTAAAAVLARAGRLLALPVDAGWWIDVDDVAALREAERRLLDYATASGGDGPVARYLNRRISRHITARLATTRLTPDGLSWIAFGLCAIGAAAFAAGAPVLGGVLCQLASIVDGSDGELARLRLEARAAGAFLDTVLDRYADAIAVVGLILGALAQGWAPGVAWGLGLAALAGLPMSALMKDRVRLLFPARRDRRFDPLRDDPPWLRWVPGNRDGRFFIIFLAGLLGQPLWALALLAVVSHTLAAGRLVHVVRSAAGDA
ncbi:MAG TPA: NTP transferase domain-containing protein [Thermaerobacter sp.]